MKVNDYVQWLPVDSTQVKKGQITALRDTEADVKSYVRSRHQLNRIPRTFTVPLILLQPLSKP